MAENPRSVIVAMLVSASAIVATVATSQCQTGARFDDVSARVDDVNRRIDDLRVDVSDRIGDLRSDIDATRAALDTLTKTVQQVAVDVAVLRDRSDREIMGANDEALRGLQVLPPLNRERAAPPPAAGDQPR